jgi:ATP synthase protein I
VRLLAVQAGVLGVSTLLAFLWRAETAQSIALGGLAYLLPHGWFAWQTSRYRGARQARKAVAAFYRGEAGKYVMTGAVFATVFATVETLDLFALFGAYIGMTMLGIALLAFAGGTT